ncbi:MAG TPA: S1/P1 nuclease [Nitrospira sp.]|nr:S1/P1 nuclease [Nitrospira sp.]
MKTLLFCMIALAGLISHAAAWGDLGHMMAAAIAYERLTPEVRQNVTALLKLNPRYAAWVADVPEDEKPRVAFLRAARWADDIKADPAYQADGMQNGNRPSGRKAARNVGYADKLMHKYWHFVDLPFSPDHTALAAPETPNARTQIALFRSTLKSANSSNALKSYDLVWLIHLVADVHQPLHAISRFDAAHPDGDAGGNGVLVCRPPCQTQERLHAFWDHILGVNTDHVTAIDNANQLSPADPELASIADEDVWIRESFEAAQTHVYVSPIEVGDGPYEVTDSYVSAARELAGQRIALAGARLANLLNDALR